MKCVPIGIFVDEVGRLVRPVGHVDISDERFRSELIAWIDTGVVPATRDPGEAVAVAGEITADEREANARYQLALVLLDSGKLDDATAELNRAMRLDRENWIIRKQLWAMEHPDAFYDGPVDYAWQKEQIAREDASRA